MQLYGASRKMFNHLHEMSLAGQSVMMEAMLPTTAFLHGLKVVALEDASPYPDAYHCCWDNAERLYRDFALDQTCTNSMLLHPVKKDVTADGPLEFSRQHHSLQHRSDP